LRKFQKLPDRPSQL